MYISVYDSETCYKFTYYLFFKQNQGIISETLFWPDT